MIHENLKDAQERLEAALEGLQAALAQRADAGDARQQFELDMHAMALDRARLARQSDDALADLARRSEGDAQLQTRVDDALARLDTVLASATTLAIQDQVA